MRISLISVLPFSLLSVLMSLSQATAAPSEPACRLTSNPRSVFFRDQKHPLLELPEMFKKILPKQTLLREWQKEATKKGWPYVTFNSEMGDQRTIWLDAGNPQFDRWIRTGESGTDLLDIIVIDKTEKGAGKHPRIWFAEYKRPPTGGDELTSLRRLSSPRSACYSCHVTGMRTIKVQSGQVQSEFIQTDPSELQAKTPAQLGKQRLDEFNARLRAYKMADFRGTYEPERRFPPMGGTSSCLECHDGKERGVLTPLAEGAEIHHKMIRTRSMPPGKLSEGKRIALFNRYFIDYPSVLRQWMKSNPPCPPEKKAKKRGARDDSDEAESEDPTSTELEQLEGQLKIGKPVDLFDIGDR